MDKEIKVKWLEALRSGNYKQGRRCLRKDDRFCCLGVLCDISKLGKWEAPNGAYCGMGYVTPEGFEDTTLTTELKDFAGLEGHFCTLLADMNDGTENTGISKTFEQIANYIEANL